MRCRVPEHEGDREVLLPLQSMRGAERCCFLQFPSELLILTQQAGILLRRVA